MAYKVERSGPIPVSPTFPLRQPLNNHPEDYFVNYQLFYDPERKDLSPLVIHFHGSGKEGSYSLDYPWIQELLSKGYMVLCALGFGAEGSSENPPWVRNYGGPFNPLHYARFIREGHLVNSVLRHLKSQDYFGWAQRPIILIGQSMGALGIFSWAAHSKENWPECYRDVKCIIGNGTTASSFGGERWIDVNRGLAAYSHIFRKVQHPSVALYGVDDEHAPLDYARRLQMTLPPESPVRFIYAPSVGHYVYSDKPKWFVDVIDQMYRKGRVVIDGEEMVSGVG